jgi:hypothetical protein
MGIYECDLVWLQHNRSLQSLDLNEIGVEGTKAVAEALKVMSR